MARRRWTEKRKAELLAECASSGLSAAAFCRDHRLPYQSFLVWRRGAADGAPQNACGLEFAEFEVEAPGARRDVAGPGRPSNWSSAAGWCCASTPPTRAAMILTHSVKVCLATRPCGGGWIVSTRSMSAASTSARALRWHDDRFASGCGDRDL
jgi:hypothetical protein